jgi:hypothetical protein
MPDQKISELSAIVTIDNSADVLPIVDTSATTTKKVTPTQLKTSLSLNNVDNTSDLNKPISTATQTALDAKVTANASITGATKTKVTYDAKGLVTAGADATTADIADSTNKRYVTDAQLTVIGNTSGTNTGDNAVNSLYSGLATSKQDTLVSGTNIKTVNSTSVLGSGNIAVQETLVSGTNIKTINSTSLLGSGNISVAPASGIDATAIGSGSVSNTEFGYLDGVTSAIQTQLDSKTAKLITTNRQTASYTLVLGDADKLVEINNASANNLTVPPNSSVAFSTGTQILLAQYGAGQTTVVAGSGVTIRSNGGKLKLSAQYSGATLIKIDTNEWYLFGDIAS